MNKSRSRFATSVLEFANKSGVGEKLMDWGDEELLGLSMESASALSIPPHSAARLVSFIRTKCQEETETRALNRELWAAARKGFDFQRGLLWSQTTSLADRVEILVRQGADIDSADVFGDTALHAAAARGHKDIVARLLQLGASVLVRNLAGKPPSFKGMRPLHAVAEKAPEKELLSLLELKCDPNEVDDLNQTALHLVSKAGRERLARALLEAGSAVCPRDKRGRTPLHWATSEGHTACTKVLLEKGADVHARTEAGTTPLHWVAVQGCVDTARMLLDGGADVNARNNDGFTPLDRTTKEDMKKLLADAGGRGSLGWWSLRG